MKAMKGNADKGCWACPRLLTGSFYLQDKRKTRRGKSRRGGRGPRAWEGSLP